MQYTQYRQLCSKTFSDKKW